MASGSSGYFGLGAAQPIEWCASRAERENLLFQEMVVGQSVATHPQLQLHAAQPVSDSEQAPPVARAKSHTAASALNTDIISLLGTDSEQALVSDSERLETSLWEYDVDWANWEDQPQWTKYQDPVSSRYWWFKEAGWKHRDPVSGWNPLYREPAALWHWDGELRPDS